MKTTRLFFKPLLLVCYLVIASWSINGQNLITPDGINGSWWPNSALHSIDNSGLIGPVPTTWAQAQNVAHVSPATIGTATYSHHNNNFLPTMTYTFNSAKNIDGMVLWQPCAAHPGGDAPINIVEIISEKCGIATRDTIVTGLPSIYAKKFNFTPKYGVTSITLNIIETWVDDDYNATDCDSNSTWTSTDINSTFAYLYNYSLGEIKFTEAEFIGDIDCEDGAYCCDGENHVENGNFEYGNIGFTSSYTQTATTYPGEYDVTSNASAFGANVNDHSFCDDPTQYPNNRFLVVNGRTQKNGNSLIWRQVVSGLKQGERYKFCANFKNMPQCTFDILPQVNIRIGSLNTGFQTINVNPADPCDWQNIEVNFTASGANQLIRIFLDETGNGDGNDLAIDDISVQELTNPNLNITVQHQGSPQQMTGSLNTISTSDDVLHGADCEYYWFSAIVDSYPPIVVNGPSFASGNASGNSLGSSPWNLTTTFPDYTFNPNTLYIVGMYTPECECYDEGFTYQLSYNNKASVPQMTEAQKQQIIYWILNGYNGTIDNLSRKDLGSEGFKIYPNPTKGSLIITMDTGHISSYEIISLTGQSIMNNTASKGKNEETIDVSALAAGMYFIKITSEDNQHFTSKFLKE